MRQKRLYFAPLHKPMIIEAKSDNSRANPQGVESHEKTQLCKTPCPIIGRRISQSKTSGDIAHIIPHQYRQKSNTKTIVRAMSRAATRELAGLCG